MSLGEWVQTFRRKAVTSSSRSNSSKRNLLGLYLAIKMKALRSLGIWGASDAMTYIRIPEEPNPQIRQA
jgi:hypothetical protein